MSNSLFMGFQQELEFENKELADFFDNFIKLRKTEFQVFTYDINETRSCDAHR
jgi:hypothetical protein